MAPRIGALLLALAALRPGYRLHTSVLQCILHAVCCRVYHMYAAPCHDSVSCCKYSCKPVMLLQALHDALL